MYLPAITVTGPPKFNNYHLIDYYLRLYAQRAFILYVSGDENYTEHMAKLYAKLRGYHIHDCMFGGKVSYKDRYIRMINQTDKFIHFCDPNSTDPKDKVLSQLATEMHDKVITINIGPDDYLVPDPELVKNRRTYDGKGTYIGRSTSEPGPLANPFKLKAGSSRVGVISRFMAKLLSSPLMIREVLKLDKNEPLICHCSPQLCHGDAINWLRKNARSDLMERIGERTVPKNKVVRKIKRVIVEESVIEKFNKEVAAGKVKGPVVTTSGITIAKAASGMVPFRSRCFYEIHPRKIDKSKLMKSLQGIKIDASDKQPTREYYTTKDSGFTEVFHQIVTFDSIPFRENMWYVSVTDVNIGNA